ncbi:MAG: transglutaminase [Castellaniella sp.]|uniref:transglutaminase-like cysteine peptidase n=1 Tax=Castellaniella sp. TaxID=1955812 RepID=UPI001221FCC9|nr:transglutaminase-like cysteine peptidase [Castellaniella sp.]TAN31154.1 MAG: transglutaminase [Castellaniella sp.]
MPFRRFSAAGLRALLQGASALALCLGLALAPAPAITFDPSHLVTYARQHYGAQAGRAVQAWQDMLREAAGKSEQEKLRIVNQFWDQALLESEDITVWGQVDYWATPMESLAKGAGDCEDYVIGKYFSLLYLGVAPEKLRLVYVRAMVGTQSIAHMVLGYYPQPLAEPLVLDSLIDRIQPAHLRPDLTPVFSFNAEGIYIEGSRRSSVDRIGRWRDLLTKMRAEGFQP